MTTDRPTNVWRFVFGDYFSKMQPCWNPRALLAAYIPVALGYGLATFGLEPPVKQSFIHPWLALMATLGFTFTHAVFPAFFYFVFQSLLRHARKHTAGPAIPRVKAPGMMQHGFLFLHMGLWYGTPMLFFAAMLGPWYGPVFVVTALLQFALAGRNNITWTFLQYGSTSLALLLYTLTISLPGVSPVWPVLAVLGQAGLLTLLEVFARPLWTGAGAGGSAI